MIASGSLFLAALYTGAVWAAQAPLSATSDGTNCLALSGNSPRAIFEACCSGGTTSGKGSVDGVEFTYSCEQWAAPYQKTPVSATSARECAQRCAASAECPASLWSRGGDCFFITSASYNARPTKGLLLLEKTGHVVSVSEPGHECDEAVDIGKAQCEKDAATRCETKTAALTENAKAECAKQVALIQSQCETEASERCKAEVAVAVQEKTSQCEQEKASLAESGRRQCEAEKVDMCASCDAERLKLQKELDEANQKLKKLEAGASTGTSASSTSPENEALIQEISRENFASICPRFGGKTFITTDSQGYKHEWTLHCHTNVAGASTPNYNFSCHTQDIIQLLKEQQENPSFRALWVNTNNVCTPWTGGTVVSGGSFLNHHLVLPTRQPWK
ncbi:hypothetical protein BDV26DRAFT_300771 [Aspergillus bertholletiae]|uniref:Apple domain-containing protein n=1 Tax=Aspergillus bertholletiae TaxID=1226010 RepID=A0A5N7BJ83_9EURO|nr:hypothetical protein BDV26DRAFT_300771 [Aspergillus bertholletiae]